MQLKRGLPPRSVVAEVTLTRPFATPPKPGDILTVFWPFPLTVASAAQDASPGLQLIEVEPYDTENPIPEGSVFATLDNLVRFPLAVGIPGTSVATSLRFHSFSPGEDLVWGEGREVCRIQHVDPVTDIVYLDESFLPYSGLHDITPVTG